MMKDMERPFHSRAGITRRQFGIGAAGVAATALSYACGIESEAAAADKGRITARPIAGIKTRASGEHALGLGASRDAILQMPSTPSSDPMPLVVLMHGAGSEGA